MDELNILAKMIAEDIDLGYLYGSQDIVVNGHNVIIAWEVYEEEGGEDD